jgi:hypothetical protein
MWRFRLSPFFTPYLLNKNQLDGLRNNPMSGFRADPMKRPSERRALVDFGVGNCLLARSKLFEGWKRRELTVDNFSWVLNRIDPTILA